MARHVKNAEARLQIQGLFGLQGEFKTSLGNLIRVCLIIKRKRLVNHLLSMNKALGSICTTAKRKYNEIKMII